jgi:mono/diheme cytochrome c family protein
MKHKAIVIAGLMLGTGLVAGCGNKGEVSFQKDVMPIFKANCLKCHAQGAEGYEKSGLGLYSYEAVMKGTKFGPVVKPGDSLSSVLNQVVEGRVDKSIHMPHGGSPLPEEDIATLKAWVQQGAKNN